MKSITIKNKKLSPSKKTAKKSFPIVAIGASAGGLEAVTALLKNLPANTGMAYIYVQHLSPNHKSFLTSILSKITKMKVNEIDDMELMKPDNVYVIPPNKEIKVMDGHIELVPRPKNSSFNLTIDLLFSTLAQTHKKNIIGVVLSGYASDGMIGLKAIKDAGGITFAQDDSAQASSMPHSAIASGVVDYVLSPEEIAKHLVQISKNGFPKRIKSEPKGDNIPKNKIPENKKLENNNSDIKTIFEFLLKEKGVDFSHYKMPTIKRRLNHKMQQSGVKTIKEYAKLLLKNNKELDLLYKDLLINVTGFFRDKEAFDYLINNLLPEIIKNKTTGETLRIWVPACSSGQEAYSIAMLIIELQNNKTKKIPVQIFGTDLSHQAIRIARIGEYLQSEVKTVSKKYLDRFFTKTGDKYQVVKELREMCVFAPHNILRDPPFSRMDFISCRNLLIYFDTVAQKRVFATLHFALKEKGYLMLGKAETIGTSSQFFTPINNKYKIYSRKKNNEGRKLPELTPHFPRGNSYNKKINSPFKIINANQTSIEHAIDSALLSRYTPACAVINKDMEVLQFRGPISLYLSHPSGKASLNILKMIRPEFAFELRNAIHKAAKTKQTIIKSGIEINPDNHRNHSASRMMSLEVSPLKIEWDEPLLLIVFTLQQQVEKFIDSNKGGKNNTTEKDKRIKSLIEELNNVRAEMNSIIETHETTHEELQAANEEIVSSNEEFQTLNEELETSKEEIEATNEELISANQNLQTRNDLLTELQEYSDAIIATIHEPMLVLNKDFRIKSANKSFYKKFLVKKEETEGIILFELGNGQWNIPILRDLLSDIFAKNHDFKNFSVTHKFPNIGEKVMLLNAHLIIQKVHNEKLLLLAIEDITERSQYNIKEKNSRSLIEASLDPLITINTKGKITDMNLATVNSIGMSREKITGTDFFDYFTEPQKASKVYKEVFAKGSVADSPLTIRHKNGKLTDVLFNGSVYKDDEENVLGVVIVARNITEQKKITANLEKSLKEISDYKYALDESSIVAITDENGIIKYVNENQIKVSKYSREELIGENLRIVNSGYHSQEFFRKLWTTINSGKIWKGEIKNRAKDGSIYWVDTTIVPFLDNGKPYQYVAIRTDITEKKRIEKEMRDAKLAAEMATKVAEDAKNKAENATEIAEYAVQSKQQFLSNMSHEIRTPMNAIIGFTNVVLKTDLNKQQQQYINAIKLSGDALIVLINDILDIAKVDSGKMTFEQIPFNLSASVSSMLYLFETKIQEKNLELVAEFDSSIPEVLLGDPVRLRQIILNLISNALKFTDVGTLTVKVLKLNEDEKKVTVQFIVKDTGIGISKNKIGHIFDNFGQATHETNRLYGGTGLGLAIVKQLVELQGGTVTVLSELGKGSTFSFDLDFIKTKQKIDVEEVSEIKLETGIKKIKILVVEDIASNQLLMKTILSGFGFEFDIADNGKIALEKLQKNNYDIILMDLQMPVMDGFETTKYIRTKMKSQIPIIALTADVTTVDVERCKAVGMNDYLSKPIDEKLLHGKIIKYLKKPELKKSINLDYLKQLTKNNSKTMSEIIEVYLEETPQLIKAMKEAIDTQNADSLRRAAHSMIPSFSMMGINTEFSIDAKKIQEYATAIHDEPSSDESRKEKFAVINELFLKIENICKQAAEELNKELVELKADES